MFWDCRGRTTISGVSFRHTTNDVGQPILVERRNGRSGRERHLLKGNSRRGDPRPNSRGRWSGLEVLVRQAPEKGFQRLDRGEGNAECATTSGVVVQK